MATPVWRYHGLEHVIDHMALELRMMKGEGDFNRFSPHTPSRIPNRCISSKQKKSKLGDLSTSPYLGNNNPAVM